MYNRYREIKNIYNDYIIFIKRKNKDYKLYSIDKKIFEYLNLKKINFLKIYEINYLILDNLDIIEKYEYENNKYYEYYIKVLLINTIKNIERNI